MVQCLLPVSKGPSACLCEERGSTCCYFRYERDQEFCPEITLEIIRTEPLQLTNTGLSTLR